MGAADAGSIITLGTNPLTIKQGTAWATGGKSISFVASSVNAYNSNSVTDAKNELQQERLHRL